VRGGAMAAVVHACMIMITSALPCLPSSMASCVACSSQRLAQCVCMCLVGQSSVLSSRGPLINGHARPSCRGR
jgi:hypothetical protein